eukprot:12931578-Prorocentrum_lima.AAC.1
MTAPHQGTSPACFRGQLAEARALIPGDGEEDVQSDSSKQLLFQSAPPMLWLDAFVHGLHGTEPNHA